MNIFNESNTKLKLRKGPSFAQLGSFSSAYFKLTAWYVAVLMAISLLFSVWVYSTARHELRIGLEAHTSEAVRRPGRVIITSDEARQAVEERMAESRRRLVVSLVGFNIAVLSVGAIASYLLAKRTLRPIRESTEAMERFTADASHELRTPLTAMKTEIEVALRDKKITKDEAAKLLTSNLEEIDRLSSLAEGLLTLTRADAPLTSDSTALDAAARQVIKRLKPLADIGQIDIKADLRPVTVQADQPSLEKIIGILLDNAIKYSPSGTNVTIKTYKKDHHAYLEVRDQGIGIKATELPHIFDRFYRADTSRSKLQTPGHGLGLSIAQKLAENMNGKIETTSTPGKGSVFTLKMPLS